jgi:hypothetical protein
LAHRSFALRALSAGALFALLGGMTLPFLVAEAATAPRIVGCSLTSVKPALRPDVTVAETPDGEGADQAEEDQQPKIVGSIPKPQGVSEDNSRKLESLAAELGVTTTREAAVQAALGAVDDPTQRQVVRSAIEGENGFVIWSVKTVRINPASGPDPKLEAKVDAGGHGDVLSIECDPGDD